MIVTSNNKSTPLNKERHNCKENEKLSILLYWLTKKHPKEEKVLLTKANSAESLTMIITT